MGEFARVVGPSSRFIGSPLSSRANDWGKDVSRRCAWRPLMPGELQCLTTRWSGSRTSGGAGHGIAAGTPMAVDVTGTLS